MIDFKFNLEKTLKEIEENEYLRKTGFKELIHTSAIIVFKKLKLVNKEFNPLKEQNVLLKFEMSDFSKNITQVESTSNLSVEVYKKALIFVALKRLKGTRYTYFYKEKDFQLRLEFNFLKTISTTFPIEINIQIKNLPENKEIQNLLIEDFIFAIYNQIDMPKRISEEIATRTPTYIQSGHYGDMKLKHRYKELKKGVDTTLEFEDQGLAKFIKEEKIVLGIRLSVSEDRILNSILKLLHDKSDRNLGSENFFKGNLPAEKDRYGGQMVDFPVLSFSPSELYKEYIGKNDYSGAEAIHVKDTLINLASKNFLFIYKRHKFDDKGNELIDRIEEYRPLLQIRQYYENITPEEDLELDNTKNGSEKGTIVVSLNHIFIDQIDTKFIEYPSDINQRTVIASGGVRKVTESNTRIRDYFLRELSNGHHYCEINDDKLPYVLGLDNFIKAGKKKRIEKKIQETLDFALKLKIITGFEIIDGSQGQSKYKFYLNTNF
ncbi:MAG: hypothetical protein U0354_18615 [Candidatus Sericytochromatia bacterium]